MPCTGAFVQGSPVLSWVGNNTAKLQLQHGAPYSNMQCWTLISTNSYGQVRSAALHKTVFKAMGLQAPETSTWFKARLLLATNAASAHICFLYLVAQKSLS